MNSARKNLKTVAFLLVLIAYSQAPAQAAEKTLAQKKQDFKVTSFLAKPYRFLLRGGMLFGGSLTAAGAAITLPCAAAEVDLDKKLDAMQKDIEKLEKEEAAKQLPAPPEQPKSLERIEPEKEST